MIASTTLLNRPGTDLADIDGVHAVTDVTGFGLLGHLREMCEGSGVAAVLERDAIPVFAGARRLAEDGVRTGASGRVWASVGDFVTPPDSWPDAERDLLCDPQTSGGLLVSCAPERADEVLALFRRHGHQAATVIGRIEAGQPGISLA